MCFNPHTHEGCDSMCTEQKRLMAVSIHTPTKGVTYVHLEPWCCGVVSIHTPTKGVTDYIYGGRQLIRVSIHTPTKGVTSCASILHALHSVSIHTPTKGVTNNSWGIFYSIFSFNPHTHEGCDRVPRLKPPALPWFQSTHPRRVWRTVHHITRRSDDVSIHTPTKGVTSAANLYQLCETVSIHTPTKGVTPRYL